MDDKPSKSANRLTPARPQTHAESAAYLPKLPWRYVLLATLSLLIVVGGFYWKEQRRAAVLRATILRVHETELAPTRNAYLALRAKLERLTQTAASGPTEDLIDARLNLAGLRSGKGLYLRLALSQAASASGIAEGAKAMDDDMIASCLGLSPMAAGGLYENGEFLLPEFVAALKEPNSVMGLRVRDDMLSRHIRNDLPSIVSMLRSDWFMLVLQEGANRRDAPVRVWLWDLAREQLLLRARVRSQGVLLTTHILSKGTNPDLAPEASERSTGAANDCSIAAALKRLAQRPAQP